MLDSIGSWQCERCHEFTQNGLVHVCPKWSGGVVANNSFPMFAAQQSVQPTASGVGKRGHFANLLVSLGKYLVKIGGG